MCQDCGCGDVNLVSLDVQQRILARNDDVAGHNRAHFQERGILSVNLMGSPGSGKTAILEATARASKFNRRLAAVAGDLATDHDAARLQKAGIPCRAITTGQACHLDAEMVHHALHHVDLTDVDLFFIENVGNLVCPAVYDLGQSVNVVALSITEGEDKPLKYPTMFAKADLVLLTKFDLLAHLPKLNIARLEHAISRVMPRPGVISIAAEQDWGIEAWIKWLDERREMLVAKEQLA